MRQNMEARYFIPILAVYDALTCALSCWHMIMDNTFFIQYPSDILCRFVVFLLGLSMMTSVSFLLAIAVQRYLKICRPLGKQMDQTWKRATIGIIIVVNLLYNVPTILVAGSREVNGIYLGNNITSAPCFTGSKAYPSFEKIYYMIVSLFVVGNIIATTGLYIPVGVVVYKQLSRRSKSMIRRFSNTSIDLSRTSSVKQTSLDNSVVMDTKVSSTDVSTSDHEATVSNEVGKCHSVESRKNSSTSWGRKMSQTSQSSIGSSVISTTESERGNSGRETKHKTKAKSVNFNVMFLVIVIVYVISFIPTCAMLLLTKSAENFWWQLSPGELLLYNVLSRSYIINHVSNPFIFGYFDLKFREHLLDIVCKCRRR